MEAGIITRQQRRAEERRAGKPAPATIQPTSVRKLGRRTKGLPFSRCVLTDMTPFASAYRTPALLHLKHATRKTTHVKQATPALLSVFFPALPPAMADALLGR